MPKWAIFIWNNYIYRTFQKNKQNIPHYHNLMQTLKTHKKHTKTTWTKNDYKMGGNNKKKGTFTTTETLYKIKWKRDLRTWTLNCQILSNVFFPRDSSSYTIWKLYTCTFNSITSPTIIHHPQISQAPNDNDDDAQQTHPYTLYSIIRTWNSLHYKTHYTLNETIL